MKHHIRFKKRKLEQDLELPGVEAVLVTHVNAAHQSRWYVRFFLPGPDERFNPGLAIVPGSKIPALVEALKAGLEKMYLLENESYQGAFSEDFVANGEVSDSLAVTISSVRRTHFFFWHYTQVTAYFLISSETNTFLTSLSTNELSLVIDRLSSAEDRASQLFQMLRQ
jgi:hypothetical protein